MPMTGFRRERGDYAAPFYPPWAWDSVGSYAGFGSWGACGDGYQAPQIVLVTPQPEAPPPPPPPPPEPARLVTHEYSWPASAPAPASDSEGVFKLVSRDGTVRLAISVWVQDGTLNYIAPDRTAGRTSLDNLDREATLRLNAASRLTLTLPPG